MTHSPCRSVRQSAPRYPRWLLFGTCCTRDGIRPSRSHGYSPAEQALAQRRQLQPPHLYATPSGTGHFTLPSVRTDLHADRIPPSTRLISVVRRWQRDFTVERQRPGLAVHRQHAPRAIPHSHHRRFQ
ncbi:hypothetical protein ECP03022936_4992 [Escherichia coli P0302293.6]|nr:hypothetical protein ECP03022936_4992 [Escherichia coli P0302293.6]